MSPEAHHVPATVVDTTVVPAALRRWADGRSLPAKRGQRPEKLSAIGLLNFLIQAAGEKNAASKMGEIDKE